MPTSAPEVASILATAGLLLLHVPPPVVLFNVIVTLGQTVEIPVIVDGGGVTVIE